MKITYINHSSFAVELDTCVLLFDYFKGDIPKFSKNKKIYVFSSHGHHDHFSPKVLKLEKEYDNILYILSDDIQIKESDKIIFVKEDEKLNINDLQIQTLKSTDIGVAFIVNVEGLSIYHAGDLNWWHWEGENSIKENKEAELMYKKEIDKIKDYNFDLAFVPLDPRQGEQYYLGFDTFMKNTNTKVAFPMHCWGDYTVIDKLKKSRFAQDYKDRVIEISKVNETFNINVVCK